MNKFYVSLVIFSVLVFVISLWTYTQAISSEIMGCVARNGILRVVGAGFRRESCTINETSISWNKEGPQGPQGLQGEQGPQGERAPNGAGNIVFMSNTDPYVILTDGTVWMWASDVWRRLPQYDSPIPVSQIVSWQRGHLLDASGNLWTKSDSHLPWVNHGSPAQ